MNYGVLKHKNTDVVRDCVASRSKFGEEEGEGEGEEGQGQDGLEIICLGLGSPSNSPEARSQLCFLLKLRDALGVVSYR